MQGKVRRMRPSPFHKGSGASKTAAVAKEPMDTVSEDDDDQEVHKYLSADVSE